jgi:photosystem II stability/assembly factor-like uncharacterized protein
MEDPDWAGTRPFGATELASLSCGGASFCAAAGGVNGGVVLISHNGGRSWSRHDLATDREGFAGVACASRSVCTAVVGEISLRTADAGATWAADYLPPRTNAMVVACPSTQVCFAGGSTQVGSDQTAAAMATDDAGRVWTTEQTSGLASSLDAVTCPGNDTCFAVGQGPSQVIIYVTSAGGAVRREQAPAAAGGLESVSCPSVRTCFGVGGRVVETTDGGSSWVSVPSQPALSVLDLSCPTTTTCVGINGKEDAAASATTTTAGRTWRSHRLPSSVGALDGLSCTARGNCEAVGQSRNGAAIILRSSDLGATWKVDPLPTYDGNPISDLESDFASVFCRNADSCAAVGSIDVADNSFDVAGLVVTTDDGGANWTVQHVPAGTGPLGSITCASAGDCAAGAACSQLCDVYGAPSGSVLITRPAGSTTWSTSPAGPFVGAVTAAAMTPSGHLWTIGETSRSDELLESTSAASP